jgi:hypothetical protein
LPGSRPVALQHMRHQIDHAATGAAFKIPPQATGRIDAE